jgi:thiol-disulfide isomerase/thioredoxin
VSLRRFLALVAALAATVGSASACSDLQGTDGKTWITGAGSIDEIAPSDRGKVVEARGEDLDGDALDLADYRGKVVVLNVWASWCPPCRSEMPDVVRLSESLDPQTAVVLGINTRQSGSGGLPAAQTFAEEAGIPFPSFYDPSGAVPLALSDKLGPYSLPSTIVLDRQGRVAALVLGEIPGQVSMRDVIDDVVAEDG